MRHSTLRQIVMEADTRLAIYEVALASLRLALMEDDTLRAAATP